MDELDNKMSTEKNKNEDNPPGKEKPKKRSRSLVERELETSLTSKITSPLPKEVGLSTSRYGRARRLKTDNEFYDNDKAITTALKSAQHMKSNPNISSKSPAYKMQASNSRALDNSPKRITERNLQDQIENIYNANISLSRFGSAEKNKPSPSPVKSNSKVYIRTDLIQSKEKDENPVKLVKNIFSPAAKSARKSSNHLANVLERSSEKYSLNKPQNGYMDMSSVVKTLDFDCSRKKRKDSWEMKCTLSKSELFELEAKCRYQVGDIAWARIGTFPFWPCIVTREPGSEMFVRTKLCGKMEHDVIHVTFFGDNGRRSWVLDSMLRSFQGLEEFEAARDQFTPEKKKKDPRLFAAFFISDKKLALWHIAIEEAESIHREPKRLRIDLFYDMLGKPNYRNTPFMSLNIPPKVTSSKITRTDSDVSLSESLFGSLFSDDKIDETGKKTPALDVSEVVTACLDNMAAKSGITMIQRQSHMDIWLQKAKSKTPEKSQMNITVTVERIEQDRKSKSRSRDSSKSKSKERESNSSKKKKKAPIEGPIQKRYSFRKSTESQNLFSYHNEHDYSRKSGETCLTASQNDTSTAATESETPICIIDSVESLCAKKSDDPSVKIHEEVVTDTTFILDTADVEKCDNTVINDKSTGVMKRDDVKVTHDIAKEQSKEGETKIGKIGLDTTVITTKDANAEGISNAFVKKTDTQHPKDSSPKVTIQLTLPKAKITRDLKGKEQNETTSSGSLLPNDINMSIDDDLEISRQRENNQETLEHDRTTLRKVQDKKSEVVELVYDKEPSKTKNNKDLRKSKKNVDTIVKHTNVSANDINMSADDVDSFKSHDKIFECCVKDLPNNEDPNPEKNASYPKHLSAEDRNTRHMDAQLVTACNVDSETKNCEDQKTSSKPANVITDAEKTTTVIIKQDKAKSVEKKLSAKNRTKLPNDMTEKTKKNATSHTFKKEVREHLIMDSQSAKDGVDCRTKICEDQEKPRTSAEIITDIEELIKVNKVTKLPNKSPATTKKNATDTKHSCKKDDQKHLNIDLQTAKDDVDSASKNCEDQKMSKKSVNRITETEETTTVIIIEDDAEPVKDNFPVKENEITKVKNGIVPKNKLTLIKHASVQNNDGEPSKVEKKKRSLRKTNIVKVIKPMEEPEFLNYVQMRQDAVMDENPDLTQQELVAYLYKTWQFEISKVKKPSGRKSKTPSPSEFFSEFDDCKIISESKLPAIKEVASKEEMSSPAVSKTKSSRTLNCKSKAAPKPIVVLDCIPKSSAKPMLVLEDVQLKEPVCSSTCIKNTEKEKEAIAESKSHSHKRSLRLRKSRSPTNSKKAEEIHASHVEKVITDDSKSTSEPKQIKNVQDVNTQLHGAVKSAVIPINEEEAKKSVDYNIVNYGSQVPLEKENSDKLDTDKIDFGIFVAESEDQIEPYSHLPEPEGFCFKTTTEVSDLERESRRFSRQAKASPESNLDWEGIRKISADPKIFEESEKSKESISSNIGIKTSPESNSIRESIRKVSADPKIVLESTKSKESASSNIGIDIKYVVQSNSERKSFKGLSRSTMNSPEAIVVLEGIPKIFAEPKIALADDQSQKPTCNNIGNGIKQVDQTKLERKSLSEASSEPIVVLEGIPKFYTEPKIVLEDEQLQKPACSNIGNNMNITEVFHTNLERKSSKRLSSQLDTSLEPVLALEDISKICVKPRIVLEDEQSQKPACSTGGDEITEVNQSNFKRKSSGRLIRRTKDSAEPVVLESIDNISTKPEERQSQKSACGSNKDEIKEIVQINFKRESSRRLSRQTKDSAEPIVLEGTDKIFAIPVIVLEDEQAQKPACSKGGDEIKEIVQNDFKRESSRTNRQTKDPAEPIVVLEGIDKISAEPIIVLEDEQSQKPACSNGGDEITEVNQSNFKRKSSRRLSRQTKDSKKPILVLEGIDKISGKPIIVLEDVQTKKLVCRNTDIDIPDVNKEINETAKSHVRSQSDSQFEVHKSNSENNNSTRRSLRLRRSQSPSLIDTKKTPVTSEQVITNENEVTEPIKDEIKKETNQQEVVTSQNKSSNLSRVSVENMCEDDNVTTITVTRNSLDNISLDSELTNGFVDSSSDKDFDPDTVSLNSLSSETSDISEALPIITRVQSLKAKKLPESDNESVSSVDDVTLSELKIAQNLRHSTENSTDSEKSERTMRLVLNDCLIKGKDTKLPCIQDVSSKTDVEFEISQANSESDISKKTSSRKSSLKTESQINGFHDGKSSSPERSDSIKKAEQDLDTISIKSSSSEVSVKRKKRQEHRPMEEPEFLKYLEMRQDALIDEHPEVTPDEITAYLYKTWQYEESVKPEIQKNEMESTNLIKGVNQTQEPKKKKKVMKQRKLIDIQKIMSMTPKSNKILKVKDVEVREMPKRKVSRAFYKEEFSDIEEEINTFEIFRSQSKKVKTEDAKEVSVSDSTKVKLETDSVKTDVKEEIKTSPPKEAVKTDVIEEIKTSQSKEESVIELEEEEYYDEEEKHFEQLTKPKPNIFKGLLREKVCEICEKTSNLVKCKGCSGMFHIECVNKEDEDVETPAPTRGRKKRKKPRGRKPKSSMESNEESYSDEKSHDLNVSEEKISIEDLQESQPIVISDADTFETQLEAKMKEIIEIDALEYNSFSSDDGINWTCSVAGKCEIVDVKLKPRTQNNPDFKCKNCQKDETPICFVCKSPVSPKNNIERRQKCQVAHCHKYYHLECLDHWPQTQFNAGEPSRNNKKIDEHFEALTCPRHVCHTCVCDDPRGCKTRFCGDKLARCVRCPATYHSFTKCLPAGSQILSASHIVCPRHYEHRPGKIPYHVNTGWCFICAVGGNLICCDYCPTSFHADCLNIEPPEGGYMCEDCETGRLPLYGEMVWVKLGHYRWWPGIVLHPSEIPDNLLAVKHSPGEFVVRFFGQYDHYWVNRGRVFPFQEGDSGRISTQKSKIDDAFIKAMEHAKRAFEILKNAEPNDEESQDLQSSLLPPHYVKLKINRPCGSLYGKKIDIEESSLTQCECNPDEEEPCGPYSHCLNRMLLTECGPICRAGERCQNRAFEKRQYPKLVPYRTPHRGWGLKTLEDIRAGQFVIEYVGELIDETEFRRRMQRKHETRDENFYFLTLDKERMIDAGPKGNLARFMNHCCEPNCETQKWTVLGDIRVGLFAIHDIPANTEVTFNYNLECTGIEKKKCMCGAKRCSGFIGAKLKQEDQPKKLKVAAKRTYKKRKNTTDSPSSTKSNEPKRPRGRPKLTDIPTKPRELTDIEKDLLIIKNATNGISSDSDCSTRPSTDDKDTTANPLKRKRVSFSSEELGFNSFSSPSVKKIKLDDGTEVGD